MAVVFPKAKVAIVPEISPELPAAAIGSGKELVEIPVLMLSTSAYNQVREAGKFIVAVKLVTTEVKAMVKR